jgi:hypothetical protein
MLSYGASGFLVYGFGLQASGPSPRVQQPKSPSHSMASLV